MAASLIALLATGALAARFAVTRSLPTFDSTGKTLSAMAGYFIVLTNLGVAIYLSVVAQRDRSGTAGAGAATTAIIGVGMLYHALLAWLFLHSGLAWWADQGRAGGGGNVVADACATERAGAAADLAGLASFICGICGGAWAATAFWPYSFLDADKLGWPAVWLILPGLYPAFAAFGLAMIAIARFTR